MFSVWIGNLVFTVPVLIVDKHSIDERHGKNNFKKFENRN
jgi:hypothetical protein